MRKFWVYARYVANFFLLLGQFLILSGFVLEGLVMKFFACSTIIYSLVKDKIFDMAIVLSAFWTLEVTKLLNMIWTLFF